jgi:hypothetical protein
MQQPDPNSTSYLFILGMIFVGALIYFVPSIIAFMRSHVHRWYILILNIFISVTVLGWFILLFWAILYKEKKTS